MGDAGDGGGGGSGGGMGAGAGGGGSAEGGVGSARRAPDCASIVSEVFAPGVRVTDALAGACPGVSTTTSVAPEAGAGSLQAARGISSPPTVTRVAPVGLLIVKDTKPTSGSSSPRSSVAASLAGLYRLSPAPSSL